MIPLNVSRCAVLLTCWCLRPIWSGWKLALILLSTGRHELRSGKSWAPSYDLGNRKGFVFPLLRSVKMLWFKKVMPFDSMRVVWNLDTQATPAPRHKVFRALTGPARLSSFEATWTDVSRPELEAIRALKACKSQCANKACSVKLENLESCCHFCTILQAWYHEHLVWNACIRIHHNTCPVILILQTITVLDCVTLFVSLHKTNKGGQTKVVAEKESKTTVTKMCHTSLRFHVKQYSSVHHDKVVAGTLWTCCYMHLHKANKVHQSL